MPLINSLNQEKYKPFGETNFQASEWYQVVPVPYLRLLKLPIRHWHYKYNNKLKNCGKSFHYKNDIQVLSSQSSTVEKKKDANLEIW